MTALADVLKIASDGMTFNNEAERLAAMSALLELVGTGIREASIEGARSDYEKKTLDSMLNGLADLVIDVTIMSELLAEGSPIQDAKVVQLFGGAS